MTTRALGVLKPHHDHHHLLHLACLISTKRINILALSTTVIEAHGAALFGSSADGLGNINAFNHSLHKQVLIIT